MDYVMIMIHDNWVQTVGYDTMEMCMKTLVHFADRFDNGSTGPQFTAFCEQVKFDLSSIDWKS